MPPYLPWHLLLVYVSGVLESAAGVALLIPGCIRWAAWSIIAIALWIRLQLQAVIIAWAYWFTRPETR